MSKIIDKKVLERIKNSKTKLNKNLTAKSFSSSRLYAVSELNEPRLAVINLEKTFNFQCNIFQSISPLDLYNFLVVNVEQPKHEAHVVLLTRLG